MTLEQIIAEIEREFPMRAWTLSWRFPGEEGKRGYRAELLKMTGIFTAAFGSTKEEALLAVLNAALQERL